MTTGSSAGVTPAGNLTAGTKDTIEANINLNKAFIQDTSSTDGDVLNATLTAGYTAGAEQATIIGIETLNITGAGGVLDLTKVSGATAINLVNGNVTLNSVAATSPVVINSGFAGAATLNSATGNAGDVVMAVTAAGGSATAEVTFNDNAGALDNASDVVTLTTTAASTFNKLLAGATGATAAGKLVVKGNSNLTVATDTTFATVVADSTYTGALNLAFNTAVNATVITGSAQDDTFTFTAGYAGATGNDTINGGAGNDTLKVVDTAAVSLQQVTNVENVIVSGTTATTVTPYATNLSLGQTLSINGSALTGAATLTTVAVTSNDFYLNITGSAQADVLAGGDRADIFTAGEGSDFIVGGKGGDTINLTETTSVIDYVNFTALDQGSAVGTAGGTFANYDTITGFVVAKDLIRFDSNVSDGTADVDALITAKIVKASDAAATAANDLTAADITNVDKVVAFLNDLTQAYSDAADDIVAITFGTQTAIYTVNDSGSDDTLVAGEVKLLGVVNGTLTATELVIA